MGNQMQKSILDMENQQHTSFVFEIDNISEKKDLIKSPTFLSGGCKWYVDVFLNEYDDDDPLRVHMRVHNPNTLRKGWKRRANFHIALLNQSGKLLFSRTEKSNVFCAQIPAWGYQTLPLSKIKEDGFLENDKLIVKVEVQVVEVIHEAEVTGKEMLDFCGFPILYSQVLTVSKIFAKHPDIAVDFIPKDELVKTAYMNLLLGLIETLRKPPQSFSETELRNAHTDLNELNEAGFRVGWLKEKLEEVSLERKNAVADGCRVEQIEERIRTLEMTLCDLKFKLEYEKAKSATNATRLLSLEDII